MEATNIEHADRDVQIAFENILALVAASKQRKLWSFEKELWTLLLALGRAVIALFFAREAARPRPVEYQRGKVRYALKGEVRKNEIGTFFGKVDFVRPVARQKWAQKVTADLPVDRDLGLCSGFSLGVVSGMAKLSAQMPFAAARDTWRSFFEWAPSSKATLRMVDGAGKHAREFLEQAAAPQGDGEILVAQVDGGGAPRIREEEYARRCKSRRDKPSGTKRAQRKERRRKTPRPRRTKGKKSKNSKVAFLGVLYTLRQTDEGFEGPVNKRVIGTFASHRELFIWLRAEADKRGYGSKRTIFIADGSDHIWRLQQEFFPEAECCLDWYHFVEYLWKAGRCFHGEGTKALRKWVEEQKSRLRSDNVEGVLAEMEFRLNAIPKTGPGNKARRERLQQVLDYTTEHKVRMPYATFIADGLDIGSGAVEGAIRNVVRMRLDGPGMRWGGGRSEYVLHLRCILVNRQWEAFGDYLGDRGAVALAAQPEPAIPYNAKAAA